MKQNLIKVETEESIIFTLLSPKFIKWVDKKMNKDKFKEIIYQFDLIDTSRTIHSAAAEWIFFSRT